MTSTQAAAPTPAPLRARTRVAVIGGGASGVLTAINLLVRSDDPGLEVVVHEASGIVGRGIAYGTNDQRHLLNVRARHMSAFPDAPSDLLDWALRTGRGSDPQAFLPRADYAIYLQDRLADVADDRLRIRAGRVLDVVPTATGFEVVTERSTSNADAVVLCHGNQPPRPLAKVASGGELSRISLALQVSLLSEEGAATMIFDEVDAGIGGVTADVVGQQLAALGTHRQVLCVTHLAQVAARGNAHYGIAKSVANGQTRTSVRPLDHAARVAELSRMLGGDGSGGSTVSLAEELLGRAATRR